MKDAFIWVRKFDSSVWKKITIREWEEAEKRAGANSAFAETADEYHYDMHIKAKGFN